MFPWLEPDQHVIQLTHDPENVIYITSEVYVIGSQPVAKQTQCVHGELYSYRSRRVSRCERKPDVKSTRRERFAIIRYGTGPSVITAQWRIQSWSQEGFPKVTNVSGW